MLFSGIDSVAVNGLSLETSYTSAECFAVYDDHKRVFLCDTGTSPLTPLTDFIKVSPDALRWVIEWGLDPWSVCTRIADRIEPESLIGLNRNAWSNWTGISDRFDRNTQIAEEMDWPGIHKELMRHKNVTKSMNITIVFLLWWLKKNSMPVIHKKL